MIDGNIGFGEGILVKSMKEGNILYLDEINAAEADVLLRLDEALDDRRQIVLKESDGQVIKAKDSWFVIATINPLTHVGTKELPPQLLSRFPVRIRLDYPPEDIEYQIIKKHVKTQLNLMFCLESNLQIHYVKHLLLKNCIILHLLEKPLHLQNYWRAEFQQNMLQRLFLEMFTSNGET
uniref:ATPase (NorQ) n=1 Tax=uncultured marine thaumarchaeote AD1000_45_G09 TaxID=1455919 RepID=A0A075FY59_9ARCH|nr:ATPase (norQ) [uncultured marine thaumarchaeote AD1000_45_G09]